MRRLSNPRLKIPAGVPRWVPELVVFFPQSWDSPSVADYCRARWMVWVRKGDMVEVGGAR